MKIKPMLYLLFSSLALLCWVFVSPTAWAQDGNGGVVQTKGEIGFVVGDAPVTSSSSTPNSTYPPTSGAVSTTETSTVTKPAGKYPSTGELVKKSLSISGAALVLIVLVLFWWKRKKKEAAE